MPASRCAVLPRRIAERSRRAPSFPRKRESILLFDLQKQSWIPAFAGMTTFGHDEFGNDDALA